MKIETRSSATRGVTPIKVLSPHAEKALFRIGTRRKCDNGQVLITRGQTAHSALMVLSGRLRTVTVSPEGDEQLLRWLEPGELTGLSLIMSGAPFPADLIASGETLVLQVPRNELVELIRTDGEVAFAIVQVLSQRVNELVDLIVDQGLDSLENKVDAALQRLALYHGEPLQDGILLRVSQADVARAVSASRQRVNMHLQRLQERGLIRLGYRTILLLNAGTSPGLSASL